MKKQRLCMMLGSLALVGVVGVSSTYAYFSKGSEEVKNTFILGKNINIILQENKVNQDGSKNVEVIDSEEIDNNLSYDLKVGIDYSKNPHVVVTDKSNEAYVYMSVEGLDEFLQQDVDGDKSSDTYVKSGNQSNSVNPKWKKVSKLNGDTENLPNNELDGIYVFTDGNGNPRVMQDGSTDSIFDSIGINNTVTNLTNIKENIKVQAAGVQTTNEDHQQQAIDLLKKTN